MAQDLPVDPDALREQVRGKYRNVTADPGASFHFHTAFVGKNCLQLPGPERGERRGGDSMRCRPPGRQ